MSEIEFSEKALDAAGDVWLSLHLMKPKPGKEARYREEVRLMLQAAALAEREEAAERTAGWNDELAILAEALHTGWRKGADGPYALVIHKLIANVMSAETWAQYITWVGWVLQESGWTPPAA
jgi:hypothetical protein